MLSGIAIIFLLSSALGYLLIILNSKELWLQTVFINNSLLCYKNKEASLYNKLGKLSSRIIPITILNYLSVLQNKKDLEENIEHIVQCLKILIVKNEMPIINALELIVEDLPDEMQASKNELMKLIDKSLKSGMREALLDWQSDQGKFRDFISLLISINEGASKYALSLNFDNFLQKIKEENQEKIKNHAENIQLYLMGPVILMLLVMSLPLMDAVKFMLENTTIQ